jgi:hypothetical protein
MGGAALPNKIKRGLKKMNENNLDFSKLNIYQKVFHLQQNVAMDKTEKAKNYVYRTLDDMLLYLKPLFNVLRLIGTFSDGTIEGNVKRICFTLTNIDNPGEIFILFDSCIIDLNPKIMSCPQSSNVTDTFLQKRILEHLLLLTTEPDPDGIDWETENLKKDNEKKTVDKENILIDTILSLAEKAKMGTKSDLLKIATTFDKFQGYTDIEKISAKVKANLTKVVTTEQIARLMTISGKKGVNDEAVKAFIGKVWGKLSKKDLNALEYDILCNYLENKPDKPDDKKK